MRARWSRRSVCTRVIEAGDRTAVETEVCCAVVAVFFLTREVRLLEGVNSERVAPVLDDGCTEEPRVLRGNDSGDAPTDEASVPTGDDCCMAATDESRMPEGRGGVGPTEATEESRVPEGRGGSRVPKGRGGSRMPEGRGEVEGPTKATEESRRPIGADG